MRVPFHILALAGLVLMPAGAWAGAIGEAGMPQRLSLEKLESTLPPGTRLMVHPAAIERFLEELDGAPPDWASLYGHGHQDPGHDDRLFALNRERDARREGHEALETAVAFLWTGELSRYDPGSDGFPVALGPKLVKTAWGMVRFKPEDAPANLSVTTDVIRREHWRRQIAEGHPVEIDVLMTGKLIPEESIVYDFSHDEEGLGLIMPFVRVERVDFLLIEP
ncbi:MAG TPA: hypothetical protein VFR82_02890 [Nitrospira sp.]|nr:hypothetical protein [Nitrospira sp.]